MIRIEPIERLGLGNIGSSGSTSPSKLAAKDGKTSKKQRNQCIKYDFVWNNYNPNDLERLERFLKGFTRKAIYQEEDNGTPHLQGAIFLKKKARMTELVKFEELKHCSFRKCIHWNSLVKYCQKEESRIPGGRIFRHNVKKLRRPIKILKDDTLFEWQNEILAMLNREPDDRSINWYWEDIGGVGKSTFCKYLAVKLNAIVLSGKASDMKYGIVEYIKKHGDYPEIIILDVPRTVKNFLSYNGIEQIKNGLFFSTKYESDMVIGNCPHVLVFANFKPDISAMSIDRWQIKWIGTGLEEDGSSLCFSE